MTIRVLSSQLASQIAAGEVVERPSSVVKELVENAIDAGATTINIEVRQGGRKLIQVADDGQGMAAGDIETAFRRHATSKLAEIEDLNAIETLGFRGEALAAISAVSQVTAVSRTHNEATGTRLTLEGAQVTSRETVGAPQGSVIAVENLFYNVPARLKFLKTANTEKRLIDEFVTRYALAYPQIRFRLTHDNRVTFQTTGSGSLADVLLAIYGADTARQLLAVGETKDLSGFEQSTIANLPDLGDKSDDIHAYGYVGPPSLHWSNRNHITLFVNGRWIKDSSLTYAIIQAYHTLLPTGRYPLAIIFIKMPARDVDVNVHPAKTEVRFRGRTPFGTVQRAVRQTLIDSSPVRPLSSWSLGNEGEQPGWAGRPDRSGIQFEAGQEAAQLGLTWGAQPEQSDFVEIEADGAETAVSPDEQKIPIMRVVGQVGASYIITEGPDGLFLIDQHAAHERILYEKFLAEREKEAVLSQGLVAGTAVHLSPPQATLLEEHSELLHQLGFEIESFGPNAFMLRAVPALLAKQDPTQALMAVLEELEQGDRPLQEELEAQVIKRVCKTAAVKAGQTLSRAEMEAMIRQLEACANPHTCPHGRPTLIHLSVGQLAREFGRI
jgi:DNA mismatch repair protein MutL